MSEELQEAIARIRTARALVESVVSVEGLEKHDIERLLEEAQGKLESAIGRDA